MYKATLPNGLLFLSMLLVQHKLQEERKMKKIAVFIIVLVMATGSAIAQDSGFSVGAEAGVINFKNSDDMIDSIIDTTYVMPTLSYDGLMMDEALEISAELGVPFWIKPELWLGVDLDLKLTYDMGNLSIIGENMLAIPIIKDDGHYYSSDNVYPHSPLFSRGNHFFISEFFFPKSDVTKITDCLSPGIKYNLFFYTGTIYLQADLPIKVMPDAFDYVGFNFSFGWKGENGFGIKVKEYNYIKPDFEFLQRLDLTASYETDTFYGELDVGVPLWDYGMDNTGVTIIPKVEFKSENGFKFYINLPVYRLGSDDDIMFGLAVGIKKSF
jgi:hypothetical protein